MNTEMCLPWERQRGESRQAFRAFVIYRDMGREGRGSGAVAKQYGCHNSLTERWCTRWRWVERTAAYDAEIDRRHREVEEAAREEERVARLRIARKQQDVGEALLGQGESYLSKLAETGPGRRRLIVKTEAGMVIDETPGAMERLELGGRLSERAEKTQRLERSLPTEYIEQTGTLRLEHEHKHVEHFGSELDALGRDLGALGLDPGTIEALQGAIVASDAGAEGSGEGGVESGEPG